MIDCERVRVCVCRGEKGWWVDGETTLSSLESNNKKEKEKRTVAVPRQPERNNTTV